MFVENDDDLKTAIKQKLREKYTIEQLTEGEPEPISKHVSDLLQSYLQYNPDYLDIYNERLTSEDILKKLGNFFTFLEDLDKEKLALGVVV